MICCSLSFFKSEKPKKFASAIVEATTHKAKEVMDLFRIGNEKGIEKTLFLDGEKLQKEQAVVRVYEKSGMDVFIYDQKLSKKIYKRKLLEFPKELTTLSLYYLLEECKVSMENEVKVVKHEEGISLMFQYTSHLTEWKHSQSINKLAKAIKQGVQPYKDIGITAGWDEIYHWLVLICKVPKKEETIQSAISYFLPFVNEINDRAFRIIGTTSD